MSWYCLWWIVLLNNLLIWLVNSQDCILTAVMSIYQCSYRCQVLYGTSQPNQRMFYNSTSQLCSPKTTCPTGWSYVSKNNTCINDLGKKNTVINGWIISSNIQNLTVVYASCNDHGYFTNGTCFCNPGWESSKTQTPIDLNVTTMEFCDLEIQPYNTNLSKAERQFQGLSWSQRRDTLDTVFPEGQNWINALVIVSISIYSLVLIFSIHYEILRRIRRRKNK